MTNKEPVITFLLGNIFLNGTTTPQLFVYMKLLAYPDSFFIRKTGESEIKVQEIIFHENILIIPKKARQLKK